MKPGVLYRTDGSHTIGTGHVLRSIKVATVLRKKFGVPVYFATKSDAFSIELLRKNKFPFVIIPDDILKNAEAAYISKHIKNTIQSVVFDFYGAPGSITRSYLEEFRKVFDARIIAMDNLSKDVVHADAVIFPNAHVSKKLLPKTKQIKYFMGPDYLILPEELAKVKKKTSIRVKNILISLGGSDPCKITDRIVDFLKKLQLSHADIFADITFDLVIGPLFTEQEKLLELCRASGLKVRIHNAPKNLMKLYERADIAVVGFGSTMYECLALRIPALVVSHKEFTNKLFPTYERLGTSINLGFQGALRYADFSRKFFGVFRDNKKRLAMSKLASAFDSKNGKVNIAKIILNKK